MDCGLLALDAVTVDVTAATAAAIGVEPDNAKTVAQRGHFTLLPAGRASLIRRGIRHWGQATSRVDMGRTFGVVVLFCDLTYLDSTIFGRVINKKLALVGVGKRRLSERVLPCYWGGDGRWRFSDTEVPQAAAAEL